MSWGERLPRRLIYRLACIGTTLLIVRAGASLIQLAFFAVTGRFRLAAVGIWEPWFYLGAVLFSLNTWRSRPRAMDSRLDALKRSLESALEGMSGEQLCWRLPGKWSSAQVLEHLHLTYVGTTRGLEKVLSRGAPIATRPSIAQRLLTFVVVGLGYHPAGVSRPPQGCSREGCRLSKCDRKIWAKLATMDAIIAQCETRFGRHVKLLDHPILGALTAPQWRTLHLVHGRHHQKQLIRLRKRTLETR